MIDDNSNLIRTILGKYRIERLLGRGGHATVFLAWQADLSRFVAIKVLLPQSFIDQGTHTQFLVRFQQEASVIARLEHTHIVSIHDYGEQDGLAYLVMPYLSKGSLRELLAQRRTLSLQETLAYIEQAASALDYAHAQGVIHRDLKPGNFLIHNDDSLVLADFGIAHLIKETITGVRLTGTDMILGTPEYMAPEMIQGLHVDRRADIYELGIVLYQMLSGDLPFKSDNSYSILFKHLEEPIPSLHRVNPAIPPSVDAVVQKATAKNREDRFSSAGELAQALDAAINTPPSVIRNQHYAQTILPLRIPVQTMYPASSGTAHTVPNYVPAVPIAQTMLASPPRPSQRARRSPFKLSHLLLLFVVLAVAAGGTLTAVQGKKGDPLQQAGSPSPTSTPTPGYDAQKAVVADYYKALEQRNYTTAYNISHSVPADQSPAAYCNYVKNFVGLVDGMTKIVSAEPFNDDDGGIKVDITLSATEMGPAVGPPGQTRISIYEQYQVVQNGKIAPKGGNRNSGPNGLVTTPTVIAGPRSIITPDSTHPLDEQAQEAVQELYAYLNSKYYKEAYALWGNDYQTTTDYCSFLLSHVRPQQVTLQLNGPTIAQDNGTFNVPITVTEIVAEKTLTPYPVTYNVGKADDGTWKIYGISSRYNSIAPSTLLPQPSAHLPYLISPLF